MAIKLIEYSDKKASLIISLSDCWTDEGKQVWFRCRRINRNLDPSIHAYCLIIGPVSVMFGWV